MSFFFYVFIWPIFGGCSRRTMACHCSFYCLCVHYVLRSEIVRVTRPSRTITKIKCRPFLVESSLVTVTSSRLQSKKLQSEYFLATETMFLHFPTSFSLEYWSFFLVWCPFMDLLLAIWQTQQMKQCDIASFLPLHHRATMHAACSCLSQIFGILTELLNSIRCRSSASLQISSYTAYRGNHSTLFHD